MSLSEVLLNIQRSAIFCRTSDKNQKTAKNAHRYSTPKRPIGVFPIQSFH